MRLKDHPVVNVRLGEAPIPRERSPVDNRNAEQVRLINYLRFPFSLVLLLACPNIQTEAAGPITPSGLNTQVTLSTTPPAGKTQYDITGGTRPGGGGNLFHSFGDFNVPTNNI